MKPEDAREMAQHLMKQSTLTTPGEEMFLILHTGDEGLVPPGEGEEEGVGDGHCFGPFVSKEEAEEWQALYDKVTGGCGCRRAVLPVIVPRILGIIGPAGVPVDPTEALRAQDRLN